MKEAKVARWAELLLLYGATPVAVAVLAPRLALPVVALAAGCALVFLWRDPSFDRRQLWQREALWARMRHPLLLAFATCAAMTAVIALLDPADLFLLPRSHPLRWAAVLVFYPLLSVWPQELVFRTLFFHRYGALLGTRARTVAASALAFGFAHVVLHNLLAVALTLAGGWLFARTYARTRSLPAATLEHAVYGCFVFTVGLARWFWTGLVN